MKHRREKAILKQLPQDIAKILDSVGIEANKEKLNALFEDLEKSGKTVDEAIQQGLDKLAAVPADRTTFCVKKKQPKKNLAAIFTINKGGAGVAVAAGAAPAAGGAAAATEAKKEEEEEEEKESEDGITTLYFASIIKDCFIKKLKRLLFLKRFVSFALFVFALTNFTTL
ncbi:hypothetical protein RFI_09508 [Reticulomyxa filosa]|uniref:Uncharacterized protein n=1 Tax=Reticulomyxa filosa TaxID=46433 RepID=X6NNN7_RETFI|nr:hypothetical protein RFI_09508 [Reticulomyxa filosa]|eukprot:ETO27621.1 hypothetical protein RFI_09508 [Reticulomyxa filosa]